MTKTASARFGEDELKEIEEYAKNRDITRSKAIRELALSGKRLAGDESPKLEASADIEHMHSLVEEVNQIAAQVEKKTQAQSEKIRRKLEKHIDLDDVSDEDLSAFAEQPFKMISKGDNEYYIVVPRFVPFSAGHLHEQDDAWQVFIVNKYINWISELPDIITEKIDLEPEYEEAVVRDNILQLSNENERERAWEDLGGREGGLYQRYGEDKIKIKSGHEFDVISELIERGNLPFGQSIVPESKIRQEPQKISLRPYQERAWNKFLETGQIGVYWPPGLGKTFFGLYTGHRISGNKLVVVPSSTLESQWDSRIQEYSDYPDEWDIRTYQYLTTNNNMQEYQESENLSLTIFDECHTLPANTFSKLSTLNTDFRIGLSATPYREDERTDYIFALTGVPIGIEWQELLQFKNVEYPDVSVYIYENNKQKQKDIRNLVDGNTKKTLIFCDRLDPGKKLADMLDVPFVHGETSKDDRLDIFQENKIVIASRVADEGVSLDQLDQVIEYMFHGSSRRQELQRAGRLMHTEGIGKHIVQMTDSEFESYSDRLYSLEEKGIEIQLERR